MAYKRRSPQPVVEGGTGLSTITSHSVLLGNTASSINPLTNGTTGQVLTAVTGADPNWAASSSLSDSSIMGTRILGDWNFPPNVQYAAPFHSDQIASATVGVDQMVIPMNGTIDRLYVNIFTNTSTTNCTLTLNVNGSNTALVATITASTTGVYSDLSNSVNVSQGDLITTEASQSTDGGTEGIFSFRFTPT